MRKFLRFVDPLNSSYISSNAPTPRKLGEEQVDQRLGLVPVVPVSLPVETCDQPSGEKLQESSASCTGVAATSQDPASLAKPLSPTVHVLPHRPIAPSGVIPLPCSAVVQVIDRSEPFGNPKPSAFSTPQFVKSTEAAKKAFPKDIVEQIFGESDDSANSLSPVRVPTTPGRNRPAASSVPLSSYGLVCAAFFDGFRTSDCFMHTLNSTA